MNTRLFALLAAMLLAATASAPAAAGDLYVIGDASLALSGDDIRDAYLGDKQMAGGTRLVPLDNVAQQRDFLERVLRIDPAKYSGIWVKKGFRDGLSPPAVKGSDAEVIATVRANPGAIGYVATPPKDLKILGKY
jgi:hypothetical protein